MQITSRPCYICREIGNPIVANEKPVEHRFKRPLLPEGVYSFARCRRCSTLYVDSDVTDEYLNEIYALETVDTTKEATNGIEHAQILGLRLPEFRRNWELMKRVRPPAPEDRLLDLGAQTGDFGSVARQDGVAPNGIELSNAYAEACRKRWGPGSEVHCGPLKKAPFRKEEFQYITAFETLEHMCDPIEALRHMRSWLAPDGILALSVPSSDYFHFKYWLLRRSFLVPVTRRYFERRAAFYRNQVLPHTHIYNFSHCSVRLLMEQGGFKPVFIGLTGWHGGLGSTVGVLARTLEALSGSRVGFSPSILAIGKLSLQG